ncbi:MAG: protein kinase domain-containing protein [Myxococcota bacterium]
MFDHPPPLASGRYTLSQPLGQGGMATVYGGFDTMLEVERAVKVLTPNLCRNDKLKNRFLAEARAMAKLRHNNIVTVFDVGMEGDVPYIVMEMVHGGSVIDLMNEHGVQTPDVAGPILLGVLAGLQASHDKGIIHRDIKPHNVLLTLDGQPKITDFGIANMTEDERSLTKTGAIMGTLAYMPPEQRQNAKGLGPTADIFAAGATLFAMLTGKEPFDLYNKGLQEKLMQPVPEGLRPIIAKACDYEPAERYQSAGMMAIELRKALISMGVVLTPDNRISMANREEHTIYSEGVESPSSIPVVDNEQTTINPKEDWFTTDGNRISTKDYGSKDGAAVSGGARPYRVFAMVAVGVLVLVSSAHFLVTDTVDDSIPVDEGGSSVGQEAEVEVVPPEPVTQIPEPKVEAKPEPKPEPKVEAKPEAKPEPKVEAKPEPVPAAVVPEPVEAGPGKLSINSIPQSTVTIGGRSLGKWVRNLSLEAGSHTVVLMTDGGEKKVLSVDIQAGKSKVLCWSFEHNAFCPTSSK